MTFADIIRIVVRRWPIVLAMTVAGAILGGGIAARANTDYSATASLIINPSASAARSDLSATSTYIQTRMETFRSLATTAKVLTPVRDRLNVGSDESLDSKLTVDVPTNSAIISITAQDPDRDRAVTIADSVISSLTTAIREVSPAPQGGGSIVDVAVIQGAGDGVSHGQASPVIAALIGAVIGLALSVTAVRVSELARPRRRSSSRT